jgi:hypothetical protein
MRVISTILAYGGASCLLATYLVVQHAMGASNPEAILGVAFLLFIAALVFAVAGFLAVIHNIGDVRPSRSIAMQG